MRRLKDSATVAIDSILESLEDLQISTGTRTSSRGPSRSISPTVRFVHDGQHMPNARHVPEGRHVPDAVAKRMQEVFEGTRSEQDSRSGKSGKHIPTSVANRLQSVYETSRS